MLPKRAMFISDEPKKIRQFDEPDVTGSWRLRERRRFERKGERCRNLLVVPLQQRFGAGKYHVGVGVDKERPQFSQEVFASHLCLGINLVSLAHIVKP